MKKFLSMILFTAMILSLTVCEAGSFGWNTAKPLANDNSITAKNLHETRAREEMTSAFSSSDLTEPSLENITSLEDFSDFLEKEYEVVIEKPEDGTMIVSLNQKAEDEKPLSLTVDTVEVIQGPEIQKENMAQPTATFHETELTAQSEEEAPLLGDVNSNGSVNSNDLSLLMQYINGWQITIDLAAADINGDEKINNKDYGLLLRQISDWQPGFEEDGREYTYTTGQKHEKLHYTDRYLYSTLNAEQKEWYQKIDTAVNNLEEEVVLNADMSENRNYAILFLYLFDNPEHFYLANRVTISGDSLGFYYAVGKNEGDCSGYDYGSLSAELKEKIIAKKAIFEEEANRIISTIPAKAPDIWKERLIYDRILMDSFYNLGAQWDGLTEDNWTAYGIMVNKYGVCESYSEAFQTLCLYVGIRCTGVAGVAGGGHKWNAVELDGEWYMCDITFDDPIGNEESDTYHYYFNRTSDWFIEEDHNWESCEFDVPQCNGTKYDFEAYFGTGRWG